MQLQFPECHVMLYRVGIGIWWWCYNHPTKLNKKAKLAYCLSLIQIPFRSSHFFGWYKNIYKLILFLCWSLFSVPQTWAHFSSEQPVIPSLSHHSDRSISVNFFKWTFQLGTRRAQCTQPVIAVPPDNWARAMSCGFKGAENLRRTRSMCLSWNTRTDTCNEAFVVWDKKQLRRKIRRINGIWYVIFSQKNPCRLGGCWWLLEGVMEVHFS